MPNPLRPLQNYVLIQLSPKEESTASGIYLGESNKVRNTGTVVSLSESLMLVSEPSFTVGDNVLFNLKESIAYSVGGVEYELVPYKDIIAKIN